MVYYVIILERAVVMSNGELTKVIGPFASIDIAHAWYTDNSKPGWPVGECQPVWNP